MSDPSARVAGRLNTAADDADRAVLEAIAGEGLDIFLQRRFDDHIRGLAKTGINYFHPGIAKRSSNNFGTAIVTVNPGFGD